MSMQHCSIWQLYNTSCTSARINCLVPDKDLTEHFKWHVELFGESTKKDFFGLQASCEAVESGSFSFTI